MRKLLIAAAIILFASAQLATARGEDKEQEKPPRVWQRAWFGAQYKPKKLGEDFKYPVGRKLHDLGKAIRIWLGEEVKFTVRPGRGEKPPSVQTSRRKSARTEITESPTILEFKHVFNNSPLKYYIEFLERDGKWKWRSACYVSGFIGTEKLFFVDPECSGRFFTDPALICDESEEPPAKIPDGSLVVEGGREVGYNSCFKHGTGEEKREYVVFVAPDELAIHIQERPNNMDGQCVHLWSRLNYFRTAAGLRPVLYSPYLSEACAAHASYLKRNYGKVRNHHVQDPNLPGYSTAGAKAGRNSCLIVGPGVGLNAVIAVDYNFRSFFHRISLTLPTAISVGIAYNDVAVVIDALSDSTYANGFPVYVYPGNGQTNVPRSFTPSGESPNPIKPGNPSYNKGGFPITVSFFLPHLVKNAQGVLFDSKKNKVPCHFSSPEKPAHKAAAVRDTFNYFSICLIPVRALKANETYTVTFAYVYRGDREVRSWSFTTGPDM